MNNKHEGKSVIIQLHTQTCKSLSQEPCPHQTVRGGKGARGDHQISDGHQVYIDSSSNGPGPVCLAQWTGPVEPGPIGPSTLRLGPMGPAHLGPAQWDRPIACGPTGSAHWARLNGPGALGRVQCSCPMGPSPMDRPWRRPSGQTISHTK